MWVLHFFILLMNIKFVFSGNGCHGPFVLPTFEEKAIRPMGDENQMGDDIEVNLKLFSWYNLEMEWMIISNAEVLLVGNNVDIQNRIISKRRELGNNVYTFSLLLKNQSVATTRVQLRILMKIPGCSIVMIEEHLRTLAYPKKPYPTLLEIPKAVNKVKRNRRFTLCIKAKYTTTSASGSDRSGFTHWVTARNGSQLLLQWYEDPRSIEKSNVTYFETDSDERSFKRILDFEEGIDYDTVVLSIEHMFMSGHNEGVRLFFSTTVITDDNLPPVITAYSYRSDAKLSYAKVDVERGSSGKGSEAMRTKQIMIPDDIPFPGAAIECVADASFGPVVFARYNGPSDFEIISQISQYRIGNVGFGGYILPSLPKSGDVQRYICSAAGGGSVVSEYVDVMTFERVKVTRSWDQGSKEADKGATFTCNATGDPRPGINFYKLDSDEVWIFDQKDKEDDLEKYKIVFPNDMYSVVDQPHSAESVVSSLLVNDYDGMFPVSASYVTLACIAKNVYSSDVAFITILNPHEESQTN